MKRPKFPKISSAENPFLKNQNNDELFLPFGFYKNPDKILANRCYMNDEELYYIAISVSEMNSLLYQRAVFNMIHFQCDDDSVYRFMDFFTDTMKEKIMISC